MRQVLLVCAAMAAFAGNSILCRLALRDTAIDPGSFTAIRLAAGALVLAALVGARRTPMTRPGGSWGSAAALFAYAVAFSFAYVGLTAGTGALLLFGAVQATVLGSAWWHGERLRPVQWAGLVLAAAGLLALLLPGLAAPSPLHAGLMLAAGACFGAYTVRGRAPGPAAGDPTQATAGNFLRTIPFAALLLLAAGRSVDAAGAGYAVLSGALASGLGYAVWYAALPSLSGAVASTVQLCVPALAALAAIPLLHEALTPRLAASTVAILGGIALVTWRPRAEQPAGPAAPSGQAPHAGRGPAAGRTGGRTRG